MMLDIFGHADRLGPEKIVHILKPALGLKAIVVIDNCAAGPAMGGVRMASDVNLDECARLARAMTLKNAAAGLPHGGAKSVVVGDPRMPMANKERLIRAFATSICELKDYIPGPDMGTDEEAMAWIKDEIGRAVGLPRVMGGIPLDEIGATGFGLAIAAQVVEEFGGPRLEGARVAVQGFGAVGQHVARFLAEKGAPLIAACDSRTTVVDPEGLDVGRLIEFKRQGKSFTDYDKGKKLAPEDILLPATFGFPPRGRTSSTRPTSSDLTPSSSSRVPIFRLHWMRSAGSTSAASYPFRTLLPMPAASSMPRSSVTAPQKKRRSM
jgi:glutamate dehydrogenase (NAD(P)+)